MRHLAAALTLALAACSAPDETPPAAAPPPAVQPAAAPEPALPSLDISGDWRVAEIWAAPPDPGTPVIKVAIAGDRIEAQSQCKHWWWTFTTAGETFTAKKEPYPDAVCERTDSPWEKYFAEAIDRATTLAPRPDGSVLITGPGGQVLLRPA